MNTLIKEININKGVNIEQFSFPDKQPHIILKNIYEGDIVRVTCSLKNSDDLLKLLLCSNSLDNLFVDKKILYIKYLMGARYDRIMRNGDSFDLKVISDLINSCKFHKVYILDPHSDVSIALINNSVKVSNDFLIEKYNKEDAVLISPDAGSAKKCDEYLRNYSNIIDIVYCNKTRDLINGNLSLKVLTPEKCENKNCVIIDDLCDGGGTFLGIASQINPKHLTLIVTHAIFSRGLGVIEEVFDQIIISDSYYSENKSNSSKLKIYSI